MARLSEDIWEFVIVRTLQGFLFLIKTRVISKSVAWINAVDSNFFPVFNLDFNWEVSCKKPIAAA